LKRIWGSLNEDLQKYKNEIKKKYHCTTELKFKIWILSMYRHPKLSYFKGLKSFK
jgi:hypothetical protein